ncbi:UvrD-helicase domain-containing protein [Vallicoccus soli]|uniref:UvrD-helicase domain-containing protein n=1 Tax=Vallicoccus soli TaxID=2339232 RepID=UPI001403F750|nr:UvrD-helicase domain-containing protein [Vallicoccus soli]
MSAASAASAGSAGGAGSAVEGAGAVGAGPLPFDLCGPLPTGTTVLEASAGTGKTHTVGALVARFVAEGRARVEELLVITFGRAASQELRERVREHLVRAERALGEPAATRAGDDPVLALLAGGDGAGPGEVAERRRRLALALADVDAATIATTHQFCHQVLGGLGVAGDTDRGTRLVEDLDDLVVEVVDDLYVRGFGAPGAPPPPFDRACALALGRAAVGDPQARLEPSDEDGATPAGVRRRFAAGVRREVDRRKRRLGVLSYDDLLVRLAAALEAEDAPARDRMRARWRVVLVDEFQDTDPVQWQVLERAFHGHATLVLVGDPKQAVYGFRGGDVVTYLAAAARAEHRRTLAVNHRSDAPLVAALGGLLEGAELGDPGIVVRPVEARRSGSRLAGAPHAAPVRLRVVTRPDVGVADPAQLPPVARVREHVARDLAADVARLLASGATYDGRPLVAGDVAVLVSTHHQAGVVHAALRARRVPAVVAAGGSVFATPAADDWLVLLEALEQPHRSGRVRAAALTPFLGRTARDLALAGDRLTDDLGGLLRGWADLLAGRGVAALLEVASAERGLPQRVLSLPDGERRLTDLRHVGQALHEAAVTEGLGLAALVEHLRRRRAEAATDASLERTRRLDSDAAAVQVVTLHASKGLEYPVVLLPFAADRFERSPDMLLLHADDGTRLLDVGGEASPGRRERLARARAEDDGEALRLLYVGLTRAGAQVVLWWAPSRNAETSALHRLLLGRAAGSPQVPDRVPVPPDAEALARLRAVAGRCAGVALERSEVVEEPGAVPAPPPPGPLTVSVLGRGLDTTWRRTSYSALAAAGERAAAEAGVGSEPETGEREDEDIAGTADAGPAGSWPGAGSWPEGGTAAAGEDPVEAALRAVPSPMVDLPAGTAFGTLVHGVLEDADAQAGDLRAELAERAREHLARRPLDLDAGALADALVPVLRTPLGPLADDRALVDVPRTDRLAELEFELPLAGGDDPAARAALLGELAPLLREHLPPGDPLAPYAERVGAPGLAEQPLRGYLTGSLDLVVRLQGARGPRYLVADYKTNRLGDPAGPPLTAWDYRPAALDQVMAGSDYPLQALLYCVALHRFLRWRQPGYDPAVHLGGVLYLYVRGMCGPGAPREQGRPSGVFAWSPPPGLVTALSDLLHGGAA